MTHVYHEPLRKRIAKVFALAQLIRKERKFKPKEKKVITAFLAALRSHDADRVDKAIGRAFEVLNY